MLRDIYSNLQNELEKLIQINETSLINKHCPNCGIELDIRFSYQFWLLHSQLFFHFSKNVKYILKGVLFDSTLNGIQT